MTSSTDGEQLRAYEGLVHSTARMFASQVGRELGDLEQELRIRAWRAVQTYDPSRSSQSLDRYVFQAVTNKIKDYKRDAARAAKRRETYGGEVLVGDWEALEASASVEADEVYREVDDRFTLPAGVTTRETEVLLLLMIELTPTEIAVRLAIMSEEVEGAVITLRAKLADWQPTRRPAVLRELPAPLRELPAPMRELASAHAA